MEDNELLDEMISQNPWWNGKKVLEEATTIRDIWDELAKDIDRKEVICLIGLRRVGKTILMKQAIQHLIKKGTDPKRILYLSFDAMKKEEFIIKRIISLYSQNIIKETQSELPEKIYFFFDEVQKVKEWGEEVKSLYDKGLKMKFFVSGSSSMNILKGSGESLVGRIKIHRVFPFSFTEFLRYNNVETGKIHLEKIKYPLNAEKMMLMFNKYMENGGFPETYTLPENQLKPVLKTGIELTFYRDIVNIFKVKRPDVLEGLFYSFVKESGSIINYAKLASSLNTKFETIKSYIEYLDDSFLIEKSHFYSASRIKSFEKNFKVYAADHAFFHLEDVKEGLKIESLIFNHCKKLISDDVFYWQDKRKKEVDIVIKRKKKLLPVKVKFKTNVEKRELKGLIAFMEKYKIRNGVVVTKNTFKTFSLEGKKIMLLPSWLFLLAL